MVDVITIVGAKLETSGVSSNMQMGAIPALFTR